jgi:hypothetical protein
MKPTQYITIAKENMQFSPELAVTWIFGKMLCEPDFLHFFAHQYLGAAIDIESAVIHREYGKGNKRIDVCVFLEDKLGKKYAIAIEAKVHWPGREQLLSSVAIVKDAHPDYHTVTGIYLLSTMDQKQLNALEDHDWIYPILTVKELLSSYCLEGIKQGYSIRLASDMQALLMDF